MRSPFIREYQTVSDNTNKFCGSHSRIEMSNIATHIHSDAVNHAVHREFG